MKIALITVVAASLLLAGCDPQEQQNPDTQLPPMPVELVACLQQAGVTLPKRKLTAGEVERFWKTDRRIIAVKTLCGRRLDAWYTAVREGWR